MYYPNFLYRDSARQFYFVHWPFFEPYQRIQNRAQYIRFET